MQLIPKTSFKPNTVIYNNTYNKYFLMIWAWWKTTVEGTVDEKYGVHIQF